MALRPLGKGEKEGWHYPAEWICLITSFFRLASSAIVILINSPANTHKRTLPSRKTPDSTVGVSKDRKNASSNPAAASERRAAFSDF